jgi:hypothetical protein
MVRTTCIACGGTLHWDWTESFAKFGFNDGDGQIETCEVQYVLLEAGYDITVDKWGCHNTLITSVKKNGLELIPFNNPKYRFGYDDPRRFFPEKLISLLDREFPPSGKIFRFSKNIADEPFDYEEG